MRLLSYIILSLLASGAPSALAQGEEAADDGLDALGFTTPARSVGGAFAPAVLPEGSLALNVWLGAPEISAGFRQGIAGWELGGRFTFDYGALGLRAEGSARRLLTKVLGWDLAAVAGAGLVWDSGSQYLQLGNFPLFGLAVDAGLVTSRPLTPELLTVLELRLPARFALDAPGALELAPRIGAGVELHLGERWSALLMGRLGWDGALASDGFWRSSLGWQVVLGAAYRLF